MGFCSSSREAYGDNAVGYIQLKRENNICIIKAKVTPEHKIHKKSYNVTATINEEDEKVLTCVCSDCAAALGESFYYIIYVLQRFTSENNF